MKIRSTTEKNKGKFSYLCQRHANLCNKEPTFSSAAEKHKKLIRCSHINSGKYKHTRTEVLLLQPKPLTTVVITTVFTMITKITDANRISTWFQRKWTWINIPMLARKRAAKKLRMGSTCRKKKSEMRACTMPTSVYFNVKILK